ncbi:uncharacterized protein SPPG_06415 [Spizellomyces punctatus DAOM BR117]|uniref:F-box/LRR-repeat protein 15-like leucin rich repeat domain-containing protein n=1 Tax=Spizellomyces punctatus (strain DAOM BR117) TaxID=645134 RepID=A0A0L0H9Y7_SPIPD|nr:uncharacterized protein SPPG_06415 [Spizellomyces punctatus DAOM BR117]KNC97997.1 hypothetical protein SPPG_06415 [Spizellomyces punctatus DAOM BR117]|eukprot:XP_016606037.1 hypothetical protein SPPG_06415 [Spizellomyces punctatus DAOM BR117]
MADTQELQPKEELQRTESPIPTVSSQKYMNLPAPVISGIVTYLDHADQVSALLVCRGWSRPVAEAMYRAPPLQSSDSFERLMSLLNTPLPAHPYPEMIRELDIGSSAADNLYMGDLDATLAVCTNLEVFRLENCFHISNILVRSLSTHCPSLKQVDLPGCPISDSFIPVLSKNCRQIERLDLSFTNLTVASLHAIVLNCDSLIQLDLSECRPVEEDTVLDLSNKGFTRPLQWLNLRNTPVSDDLLRFTATHCPNLEDLVLESCTEITDDALVKVANTCTKLRRLDVSFCDNISDLSLQAFAMRASSANGGTLRELYLTACDSIGAIAVHNLAQKCTNLDLLVLDGCDKILGTFVQSFASQPSDELECLLEGEAIRLFAAHVPGSNPVTPPASPGRPAGAATNYKVQVSYATTYGENADVGGWRSMSNVYGPGGQDSAALAAAALEAAKVQASSGAQLHRSLSRRTSRSMLRKRSSMSLADAAAEAEAAKQERQEKIREKRRSRTSIDPTPAPPPPVVSAPIVEPTPAPVPAVTAGQLLASGRTSPPSGEEIAGAIPLASGRRRSQPPPPASDSATNPPSTTQGQGWGAAASSATSNWGAPPALVSAPASATNWQQKPVDSWNQGTQSTAAPATNWTNPTPPASPGVNGVPDQQPVPAPLDKVRRRSIPVPAGPPPPGTNTAWSTPAGLQPPPAPIINGGASVTPLSAPLPAPAPAPAAPGTETVLLASGRAARAAAAKEATMGNGASPALSDGATISSGEGGESAVLLASGRRRSRTGSMTSPPVADVPAIATSLPMGNGAPALPSPSGLPAAPQAAQPWGSNPTIWTNPAQLTSASSTWSTANSSTTGGFVDPWAKSPQSPFSPVSNDPWAAPPLSYQPPQQPLASPPVAPYPQPTPSPTWGQNGAPTTNIRLAAAPGWGAAQGGSSGWTSTSPYSPNGVGQPSGGYFERTRARMQATGFGTQGGYGYGPAGDDDMNTSSGGFVFSCSRRGKMLLKLKIETKTGGHQTLAVHEFDDPHQLASEFCAYWDMAAFREPLVRLISVRKTNAVRQRVHAH